MSVDLSREDGVAVLTVNRPDALNAFDVETLTELRDHLRELAEDSEARVVVLTGAGDRAFAAGADIKYMSGLDADRAKEWGSLGHEVGHLLETMPEADDRGDQRVCARRRLRGRARLRLPLRVLEREARPAGDQPRDHPGVGRHPAAGAGGGHRAREGADPDRPCDRRRGSASDPARQRRLRAGRAHGEDPRGRPRARLERPRSPWPPPRRRSTGRSPATTAPTSSARRTTSASCSPARTPRRA